MNASIASEPLSANIAVEKTKFKCYCDTYYVQEAQIKRFVLETLVIGLPVLTSLSNNFILDFPLPLR